MNFPFGDCSILSANNLTGKLPTAFTYLNKLKKL